MCTYHLTFNDSLLDEAKNTFPNQAAITTWMQQQIERMLRQISVSQKQKSSVRKLAVSDRIKALSAVPASASHADYKDEMTVIMSDKY